MAKTKQGKTTKGSRQPQPKYLGLKLSGGRRAKPGNIIVRQRGTKYHPGRGVKMGKDYTLFAIREGLVNFQKRLGRTFVHIEG